MQVLSLMQATVSPVIWQNYVQYSIAKDLLDALKAEFGKAGGASTYLQLVNMVKIQFTDSMDLLPQIQQFLRSNNFRTITIESHQMAIAGFLKT